MASDLDRVDHHRGSADGGGLWYAEDAKLLTLDADLAILHHAGGSKLRLPSPSWVREPAASTTRAAQWPPIFAVEELPEGMHDLREVASAHRQ